MTVADTLSSQVKVVGHAGMAEAERLAGRWLVQHTALVWAKPDGRPRLDECAINVQQASRFLLIPPSPYMSCIHQRTPTSFPAHPGPPRGLNGGLIAEVQSRLDLCPQ